MTSEAVNGGDKNVALNIANLDWYPVHRCPGDDAQPARRLPLPNINFRYPISSVGICFVGDPLVLIGMDNERSLNGYLTVQYTCTDR